MDGRWCDFCFHLFTVVQSDQSTRHTVMNADQLKPVVLYFSATRNPQNPKFGNECGPDTDAYWCEINAWSMILCDWYRGP